MKSEKDKTVPESTKRYLQEYLPRELADIQKQLKKPLKPAEKYRLELQQKMFEGMRSKLQTAVAVPDRQWQAEIDRRASQIVVQSPQPKSVRSGTGFSIGDGYIVTTADVLDGMSRPVIVTASGKRLAGTVVGIYEDLDLGIVKLNEPPKAGEDLPALTLGDSEGVTTGHFAISVGNLGGQANSAAVAHGRRGQRHGLEFRFPLLSPPHPDRRNRRRRDEWCALSGFERRGHRNYRGGSRAAR